MVSVGSWFAIGDIFSMKISGRLTWWLWRTVYLFKFFSWKKRVRIVLQWTLNVFYPRDITKLR
jgi:NADH dehydrogenase